MFLLLLVAFSCGASYERSAVKTATLVEQGQSQAAAVRWQRSRLVKNRAATRSCQLERFARRSPTGSAEQSRSLAYLDQTRLRWKARHANCERRLAQDRARWRRDPVGHAKQIAKYLLRLQGWSDQFWALDNFIRIESGWDVCAHYPSQHWCGYQGENACGIGQANPCSKMAAWGSDYRSSSLTQLRWLLLGYIPGRYGDPLGAWSHWQRYHSY